MTLFRTGLLALVMMFVAPSFAAAGEREDQVSAAYAAWDAAIREGQDTIAGRESLTESQRRLEALYLGLRTSAGVPVDLVPAEVRDRWVRAEWAGEAGERLRLSPEGWLRLDALVADAA